MAVKTMADYIKREDAIMAAMDYEGSGNAQDASQDIAGALASIPAADVRENRRGTWQRDGSFDVCPYCGSSKPVESQVGRLSRYEIKYCYFCGADMRGGEKDERCN